MTAKNVELAADIVEREYADNWVLVVFLPECHESLAGIVAGRLRERFYKPAIVLTRGEESVKGSGRSIESYHMFESLVEVQDLLLKFGGHPMAAGLSLAEENIEAFRCRLNEAAHKKLTPEDFMARMELSAIQVEPDGEFEFWFEDGEMFYGHSIHVMGNLTDGPDWAQMEG